MKARIIKLLTGAKKPIHMRTLSYQLGITERELRQHIQEIRETPTKGKFIASDNRGYFLTSDSKIIAKWIIRYLQIEKFKVVKSAKKFITRNELSKLKNLFNL